MGFGVGFFLGGRGVKHKDNHLQQINFYKLKELISKTPWEEQIKEKNILNFLNNIKGTSTIYPNARKHTLF